MKLKLHNDWSWPTSANNTFGARWAAALLPPHRTLVETCGGTALMALPISRVEVYNDLHGSAHNFFRVVRDARSRQALFELVESKTARLALTSVERDDPIIAAYNFYRACRRSWMPDLSRRWLNRRRDGRPFSDAAKLFNPIIDRFYNPQIEDLPADNVIQRYDTPQTVHLVDLSLVRSDEISSIMTALLNIKGRAVVLGAPSPEHGLLANWRKVIQPFSETPQTALVNYPERKRAA